MSRLEDILNNESECPSPADSIASFFSEIPAGKRQELLEKTCHSPEYRKLLDGAYPLSSAVMHGLGEMPEIFVCMTVTEVVRTSFLLGVQVGERMGTMPNFVVREPEES